MTATTNPIVPNAVVLVTDRLGSGYLGPYGNTWLDTPAWNRLAARATLFETALVDSPDLLQLYRSYWRGRHAMSIPCEDDTPALAELLAAGQVQTWLITDERLVAEQSEAQGFDERVVLPPGSDATVGTFEETQLARLFATTLDVLGQATPPFLIWVHAQAMQAPWDAPYPMRAQFAEQEDPDPPEFATPPEYQLQGDCDPDLLLGIQHAYGGQVALLDACLGVLLDALWSSAIGQSTALLATAARGFPIGEHRYVGRAEFPLFSELVQVPWLTCWPGGEDAAWRSHHLIQPPDMYPTLLDWFNVPHPNVPIWGRSLLHGDLDAPATPGQQIACCTHDQQQAIRVPNWFMRCGAERTTELYVKPDDRWEFNEISSRCLQEVDELLKAVAQFESAAHENNRQQLLPLADTLLQWH